MIYIKLTESTDARNARQAAQERKAMDAITILMQQIREADAQATEDSKKAMLRSMFARHHRAVSKIKYNHGDLSKAGKLSARARRLEASVADYANDLIY